MKRLSTDAIRTGAPSLASGLSPRGAEARITSLLFALALPLALAGCKEDEAPPPLPAPAPQAAPAPATLVVAEPPLEETEDKPATGKTGGSGKAAPSMKACCAALHQNAANAPPPNDGYLKTAAAMCDGMAAAGQTAGATAALQAALKGAGLPSACK